MAGEKRRTLAQAALHPLPLALLVAGGVAGAFIAWPLALGGVVGYLGGVGFSARPVRKARTARADGNVKDLVEPKNPKLSLRSTELMAKAVRLRKAHQAFYRAVAAASAEVRELLGEAYMRAGDLVGHAYELACRADELRAQLDAAAIGQAGLGGARDRLEREYKQAAEELDRVGLALEGWHAKALSARADAPQAVSGAVREVSDELERMQRVITELQQVTGA